MWYCAHAIFYFENIHGVQDSFLVHENVYLLRAADVVAARKCAEEIARANEDRNEGGHLELNDQKVRYLCAGVRKVIEMETLPSNTSISLPEGVEMTYSVFEVDSLDEVKLLGQGKMVDVLYRE